MGSFFIVVSTPILQLFAGICKAEEPMGVEKVCRKAGISQ